MTANIDKHATSCDTMRSIRGEMIGQVAEKV